MTQHRFPKKNQRLAQKAFGKQKCKDVFRLKFLFRNFGSKTFRLFLIEVPAILPNLFIFKEKIKRIFPPVGARIKSFGFY
jgi:hypothetical protein